MGLARLTNIRRGYGVPQKTCYLQWQTLRLRTLTFRCCHSLRQHCWSKLALYEIVFRQHNKDYDGELSFEMDHGRVQASVKSLPLNDRIDWARWKRRMRRTRSINLVIFKEHLFNTLMRGSRYCHIIYMLSCLQILWEQSSVFSRQLSGRTFLPPFWLWRGWMEVLCTWGV